MSCQEDDRRGKRRRREEEDEEEKEEEGKHAHTQTLTHDKRPLVSIGLTLRPIPSSKWRCWAS